MDIQVPLGIVHVNEELCGFAYGRDRMKDMLLRWIEKYAIGVELEKKGQVIMKKLPIIRSVAQADWRSERLSKA
jgi:hypothetical protein